MTEIEKLEAAAKLLGFTTEELHWKTTTQMYLDFLKLMRIHGAKPYKTPKPKPQRWDGTGRTIYPDMDALKKAIEEQACKPGEIVVRFSDDAPEVQSIILRSAYTERFFLEEMIKQVEYGSRGYCLHLLKEKLIEIVLRTPLTEEQRAAALDSYAKDDRTILFKSEAALLKYLDIDFDPIIPHIKDLNGTIEIEVPEGLGKYETVRKMKKPNDDATN